MELSLFLAKLIGIYFIVMGLGVLSKQHMLQKEVDKFLKNNYLVLWFGAAIDLFFGAAIVLSHNIWQGTYEVVITVIGWCTLIKAIILILLPQDDLKDFVKSMNKPFWYGLKSLILLVVGIYLVMNGFQIG